MAHFPKPAEGSWTEHYPQLGTGPVDYEDSISPEFYELERNAIFKKTWLNVGRVEQIPRSGRYFTRELQCAGTSVIIVRDKDGDYHVHTNHHAVGAGATWGLFWGFLFGLLFFIPVLGLAIGAGLGALMGKFAKTSIDKAFQEQVRGMVQPGTSALFLMLEKVTPDKAVEGLSRYGGTVLKTSLSKDDEKELQDALHGESPA